MTGFTQMDPDYGALSRYPVYVFVMYDSEFLYVAADLRDSLGVQPRVAELTRDFIFAQTDAFGFVLDPLHDRRNTVGFFTNPAGAQLDVQSFDERLIDSDWNTVWQVRAAITDSGWACEFAVPWKSLRYPAEATTMGINFERLHRRFNEWSVWSPHS
ncbi:MAG TPA: carbohydrate binding family 9 domain-containing protein, partial [candidate division Zixibacteria bacterium]|nr:carbohydrate binding family 9 domain-containing protein [candidate division Zixibacteria bacterium]